MRLSLSQPIRRQLIFGTLTFTFAQGPPSDAEEPTESSSRHCTTKSSSFLMLLTFDFAILGPFNRKVAKAMKLVAWVPMGDGSFLRKEIPGPDNVTSWLVSWRVFRVAGLMLNILVEMALNAYRENFEKLAALWPEAWHLLYLADDKCRSEMLVKYLRRIESSIAAGGAPPPLWDPLAPWSACLLMAAKDKEFWDEQVKDVALSWMSRGGQGAPLSPDELAASRGLREMGGARALRAPTTETGMDFGLGTFNDNKRPPGKGESKTAKRRRKDKELISSFKGGGSSGSNKGSGNSKGQGKGKTQKGRGKGKLHSKDDQGNEICEGHESDVG